MQFLISSDVFSYFKPEKWDSLTRSWRKHLYLLGAIDLLLLDEIHHIGETRGATLEAVVVRMRNLNQTLLSMPLSPERRQNRSVQFRCLHNF